MVSVKPCTNKMQIFVKMETLSRKGLIEKSIRPFLYIKNKGFQWLFYAFLTSPYDNINGKIIQYQHWKWVPDMGVMVLFVEIRTMIEWKLFHMNIQSIQVSVFFIIVVSHRILSGRKANIRAFGKRPESGSKAARKRPESGMFFL